MRSLSIIFLFVLMGFLLYSSLMVGVSRGSPAGEPFLMEPQKNEVYDPAPKFRIPLNISISNDSRVVSLVEELTLSDITYEELLGTVELVAKVGLLVISLAMFLFLVSALVVR